MINKLAYLILLQSSKLCLYFVLLISPFLSLNAQDYKHFIVEDARWVVYGDELFFPNWTTVDAMHEFFFDGDTLLNGVQYKKMYRWALESVNNDFEKPYRYVASQELQALVREDTLEQKVFAKHINYPANCERFVEELLYDFSKQIGDTINQCNIGFTMTDVGAIEESTDYPGFKTYFFISESTGPAILYYEGIGLKEGPLGYNGWIENYNEYLKSYCVGTPGECGVITGIKDLNNQAQLQLSYTENGSFNYNSVNNPVVNITATTAIGSKVQLDPDFNNNRFMLQNASTGLYIISFQMQSGVLIRHSVYVP